ncbi:hypothetical protein [Deinococcus gobiensis]|nr:hypothetical protein [Deinococcus gobiensis]
MDFSTQTPLRLKDRAPVAGDYPLPRHEISGAHHWGLIRECACMFVAHQGDPYGVIFPAMEIMRWAFGSSSGLLQAITSGQIRELLEESRTATSQQGDTLFVHVPAALEEQDAATLAWLMTDDFARDTAFHVQPSIAATTTGSHAYPSLRLPYQGEKGVRLLGRWITGTDGVERFLVHRIVRIDFTPAFQLGRAVGRPGGELEPGGIRHGRLPVAAAGESELRSDTEPGHGAARARLPALPSQFSALKPVSVPVGAPAAAATAQGTAVTPPAPWGEFSTSPGFNLTSRAGRATASIPTEERARPISADFSTLRKVAALLGGEGFQVAERGLSGANPAQFPGTTRQCLIIEVRRGQRHAYLLERERDRDEYGPLIVARLHGGARATDADLLAVLSARQARRRWPGSTGAWTLERVNHSYTTVERFRDAIRQTIEPGTR